MSTTGTAHDVAYAAIRTRIESGDYAPGSWIRESTLSTQLGISRTPLREAIRALASEGLLESVPNRGARVADWSAEGVDELYRLRALLEGYGAREAAARGGDTAALWACAARYEDESRTARSDGELESAVECNVEFHEEVLALCGSPRLTHLVRGIRSALLVQRAFVHYTEDDRLRSVVQHRDIVRAVERGDQELAELAMRTHILAARYSAIEAAGDQAADGPPATS